VGQLRVTLHLQLVSKEKIERLRHGERLLPRRGLLLLLGDLGTLATTTLLGAVRR
jgi:hypothetical protein